MKGRQADEREKSYQYWLMNIKGLGKRRRRLLQELGSAEEAYRASAELLQALAGETAAAKILTSKKDWDVPGEYEKLCRQKIKFTCYGDENYPKRLLDIPDPPFSLYYQGKLPEDDIPTAALIGARACSEYGAYAAGEFGSKLAGAGIQIISGLAMGIDGISQEAALAAGGNSFGVLGCGVDICYPKSNRRIYEACIAKGGILSEYPPGTAPAANLFPPRNRIISGLSDVVIVVEAREKSGTFITVDMALEQGREVYAVPGRITDSLSRGCCLLFQQGAGVAVSPADILEVLYGAGNKVSSNVSTNIEETAQAEGGRMRLKREILEKGGLSGPEKQVWKQLDILPKTAEELYEGMGKTVPIQEIMSALVELTIKGLAKQSAEGYSQKVVAS